MLRLLVHVEGQTEETFVNELLAEHLRGHGYSSVSARLLGNARQRDRRGGIKAWPAVQKDILRHLLEDRAAIATMMVDYYALPPTGDKAWPGRCAAAALPFPDRAASVERAIHEALILALPSSGDARRFVPYVVMHEFEALLFSDCGACARGFGKDSLAEPLQAIRASFECPEAINDSPATAPSKRIALLLPGYQKPLHGNLAALEIGLPRMREECRQFDRWLTRLEVLPTLA